MKKIFLLLCITLFVSCMHVFVFAVDAPLPSPADCANYNPNISIWANLDACLANSKLVKGGDAVIEVGFKQRVVKWVDTLSIVIGILAVGAIVYASFLLTLSAGDDSKVDKAKKIVKWSLLGFLCLISASALIKITINVMYGLS